MHAFYLEKFSRNPKTFLFCFPQQTFLKLWDILIVIKFYFVCLVPLWWKAKVCVFPFGSKNFTKFLENNKKQYWINEDKIGKQWKSLSLSFFLWLVTPFEYLTPTRYTHTQTHKKFKGTIFVLINKRIFLFTSLLFKNMWHKDQKWNVNRSGVCSSWANTIQINTHTNFAVSLHFPIITLYFQLYTNNINCH